MSLPPFFRPMLLGAALLLAGAARAQQPDSVFADAPRETLDLASPPRFALYDQAFYQNKVFLLGESHGVQRLQDVDFALLRHLNQRAGVRRYLAEVDCAKAYYLNEYLRTGDEATLARVFASWVREQAQWGNADFVAKIRRIRGLNQTLPPARRIQFVGIDGVQDYALLADYLSDQRAAGRPLPPQLAAGLDSVQTALRATPALATDLALRTQRALRQAAPAARRALGRQAYAEVLHALTNLGYARTLPGREQQLFANYQAALPLWHLTHEKLYGLWGLGHVPQQKGLNFSSLAAYIRQSTLPGHDKIVSILSTYSGCRMLMASAGLPAPWRTPGQEFTAVDKFNHDGPLVRLQGIAALKARTLPGSTTLVRLDAPGTAAHRLPVHITYAPGLPASQQMQFDPAQPATAYVQYLLLVRDSEAVAPLLPGSAGAIGQR
ncbi:hypothetical protein E4631_15405 [Hymenobacter sp. UV11]|uniref:erythromycin esterase family protein n=1 Tax=Hymenobacter sp. UV11 TaxID=1849735 RepID=UPI00105B2DE2|nr:erythromycin esterase family protein [Hymenobacter sp. UV11]TFZ65607.1 hypothetical protein E4631_15405 [Hymenobacter sp. UV11]